MIQILHEGAVHFAEVRFYFIKTIRDTARAFAIVSIYSPPDEYILQHTRATLIVCGYRGEEILTVIEVTSIISVVAMVPFPFLVGGHGDQYFVVEQIGLDVIEVEDDE